MTTNTAIYNVLEIPDSFYPRYQMEVQGNVMAAAGKDFEKLLRILSTLPPLFSAGIRFVFNPNPKNNNLQNRLQIYVYAKTNDSGLSQTLELLLENGPINRFYKLEKIGSMDMQANKFRAACNIIRREEVIQPLHSSEFNYRIPIGYFKIMQFEPNEKNDYLDLDKVLHNTKEMVAIDICLQPTDISNELMTHTKYLSNLQFINRTWDDGSEYDSELYDIFKDSNDWRSSRNHNIKPLKYPDPLADDILREQQRFHESLQQPHFMFHAVVLSETISASHLIGSIIAESAFNNGSYRLISCAANEFYFNDLKKNIKQNSVFLAPIRNKYFHTEVLSLYKKLDRLCHLSSVDEMLGLFRLPIGSMDSLNCIRKNTDPPEKTSEPFIILGKDKDPPHNERGLELRQCTKHLFLSGCSGFTKTNSSFNLLLQLHKFGVPFLVIEPVKTEYRTLKALRKSKDKNARDLAKNIEIYTPGDESISPFRLNPLDWQTDVSKEEKIENILSCIKAAIPIEGSLPALIGEALEQIYDEHPDKSRPPLLANLINATETVLTKKGYSSETHSDFRAAIDARLGVLIRRSIGEIFQCRGSLPEIDHLMNSSAIIEFDRLHEEQTCLIALFLLTRIREYLKTAPKNDKNPRYAIIIEEAHNIVGQTDQAQPSAEIANPKSFSAEYVVRMLLELRALNVVIIIVDQFPSTIAPEVIKSTSSKLAFRQVAKDDREELGASMLFSDIELEEIARIKAGEAYLYTENYHKPRNIITPNLHEKYDFSRAVYNHNIIEYISDDQWFVDAMENRIIAELSMLKERMDEFDSTIAVIRKHIASLVSRHFLKSTKRVEYTSDVRLKIRKEAIEVSKSLNESLINFWKTSFIKYLPHQQNLQKIDPLFVKFRDNLVNRFESTVVIHIKDMMNMLSNIIVKS